MQSTALVAERASGRPLARSELRARDLLREKVAMIDCTRGRGRGSEDFLARRREAPRPSLPDGELLAAVTQRKGASQGQSKRKQTFPLLASAAILNASGPSSKGS